MSNRTRLHQIIKQIRNLVAKKLGWISAFILIFAFFFIYVAIWRGINQIAPYFHQLDICYLIFAEGFVGFALFQGAATWYFVQRSYQLGLSRSESARAHFASSIARYVPGYAWQYMSKAYLSRGNRENRHSISSALLEEFVILMLSGFILVSLLAIVYPEMPVVEMFPRITWWIILIGGLFGVCVLIFARTRFFKHSQNATSPSLFFFLLALFCSIVGWFSFGLATWFVIYAFSPDLPFDLLPQVFFALIGSTLFSVLVIFVPGGIGLRESALALLLQGILPFSMGAVVSILLRVGIILGELIGFFVFSRGIKAKITHLDYCRNVFRRL